MPRWAGLQSAESARHLGPRLSYGQRWPELTDSLAERRLSNTALANGESHVEYLGFLGCFELTDQGMQGQYPGH